MSQDDQKSAVSAREAMGVFVNFHVAYRQARVYEQNNVQFQERIRLLFDTFQKILQTGEEVQIRIVQDSVFLNQIRLKFNFSNFHVYLFILEEFKNWRIGAASFLPGLTEVEMQSFIIFLSKKLLPQSNSFERLAEDLQAAAFAHIRLEKIPAAEEVKLVGQNAVPMYFLGIYHLKEIFNARQGVLNLHITKRWIQSIANLLALDESILFGMTTIKNFEDYTLNHSVNVCVLGLSLGRRLGLSRRELIELGISACLHDVGKFEIPNEIVDKPGKLTSDERALMELHPQRGAARLLQTRTAQDMPVSAFVVAFEHHLTPSLGGYPKYHWRRETSLFSRIVKIVDYYDAITTKRVYRPKTFTPEEALRLMVDLSGKEFDPILLKAFINMIGIYPIGSLVVLDNCEIGVVIQPNANAAFVKRPKVKLISDTRGNKLDGGIVDLVEPSGTANGFKRSILMSLDPDQYDIHVYDYLLSQAQPGAAGRAKPEGKPSAVRPTAP
jgi:HD-GYP domain-containing protein (c-di-GMP phosphodiesterase class II)